MEPSDHFDRLPDEVMQLIFLAVFDCKTLVRCMAVSKSFKEQSERVPRLSIICPGHFTSYVDKLQTIYSMVRSFQCLEELVVRVGQPKEEPPSWARCMRYAEIGSSVEKFIFMAAKAGEFSEFDASLRGSPVERKKNEAEENTYRERCQDDTGAATSSNNEPGQDSTGAATSGSSEPCQNETGGAARRQDPDGSTPIGDSTIPGFTLRQVVAPSNDVLKRMVPVIVFAIVQGLDDFRDSVPDFITRLSSLKTFLMVDMVESVTVYMREHHIQQIRSANFPVASSLNPGKEHEDVGETTDSQQSNNRNSDDTTGVPNAKGKGKEVETPAMDEASSSTEQTRACEISSPRTDDDDDEEVTSPVRRDEHHESVHGDEDAADGNADEEEEAWRHYRGICIQEAAGSGFVPKYRRSLKGRESRWLKAGGYYRRRERSVDWMEESARRRQENRSYKGVSFRRREESRRALKAWRREELESDESASSSSSSPPGSSYYSFGPPVRAIERSFGLQLGDNQQVLSTESCGNVTAESSKIEELGDSKLSREQAVSEPSSSFAAELSNIDRSGSSGDVDVAVNNNNEAVGLQTIRNDRHEANAIVDNTNGDRNGNEAIVDNINRSSNSSNDVASEGSSNLGRLDGLLEERRMFQWGRNDDRQLHPPSQAAGAVTHTARQFPGWRETWGERLRRRARELRIINNNSSNNINSSSSSNNNDNMNNSSSEYAELMLRRERMREGVRRRQMEIERQALRFDISFWRAEQVESCPGGYTLADVSMCIATRQATRLRPADVASLSAAALAGPLLVATVGLVNDQAPLHNL